MFIWAAKNTFKRSPGTPSGGMPGFIPGGADGDGGRRIYGHLNSLDLKITVTGSACLADTLQGLSRARLVNPPGFKYEENMNASSSLWERPGRSLTITARQELNSQDFRVVSDEELFSIKLKEA